MKKKRKMNTIYGEETKNEHNTCEKKRKMITIRVRRNEKNTLRGDEKKKEHNTWRINDNGTQYDEKL